jgi:hypothetical protein
VKILAVPDRGESILQEPPRHGHEVWYTALLLLLLPLLPLLLPLLLLLLAIRSSWVGTALVCAAVATTVPEVLERRNLPPHRGIRAPTGHDRLP